MRTREGDRLDARGDIHLVVHDFPEEVFRDLLDRDPEEDHTRSQVLQFRLPNGDLILGFYPQGDSYFEIEGWFK
jgi:hypothetical protein